MEADRSAQLVQRAQRFAAHRIDSVPAQGYAGELPLARAKADQSFWLLARSSAASVCKGTSMFKIEQAEAGLVSRLLGRYEGHRRVSQHTLFIYRLRQAAVLNEPRAQHV